LTWFFGEVLPNHTSLRDVTISRSQIQPQYWRLFAENCLTSDEGMLERLALVSTPPSTDDCQLLQQMLQREIPLFEAFEEVVAELRTDNPCFAI
jgi:hypothetical protein